MLSLTAVASGTALMLSGCGVINQGDGGGGGGGDLSVWHQFSGAADDAMGLAIKDFNKENPDLQFKGRAIANDEANTVVRTGLSGDNPPTVVQYEGYQQTEDFAKAGQLLDITDWWEENKDNFNGGDSAEAEEACGYEGKMYCIPFNLSTSQILYVNPDAEQQHNLQSPETIDDLKKIAAQLEGTDVEPISLYAGDGWPAAHWWFLLTIQRCGVDKINQMAAQDGAAWDDPCVLQSATDLYELGEAGVFPEGVAGSDYNSMLQLFLSGGAAYMNTGSWFESTLIDTPPAFEATAVPFPQVDPDNPSNQILGGFINVFGISANGDTEAGLKFLEFLGNPENGVGARFAENGLVNVVKGAEEGMTDSVRGSFDAVVEALNAEGDNVIAYFENLVPPTVGEDVMYNGSAGLAANTMEPEEFVEQLQSAAASAAE